MKKKILIMSFFGELLQIGVLNTVETAILSHICTNHVWFKRYSIKRLFLCLLLTLDLHVLKLDNEYHYEYVVYLKIWSFYLLSYLQLMISQYGYRIYLISYINSRLLPCCSSLRVRITQNVCPTVPKRWTRVGPCLINIAHLHARKKNHQTMSCGCHQFLKTLLQPEEKYSSFLETVDVTFAASSKLKIKIS